jgi:CBS domain-containing protein
LRERALAITPPTGFDTEAVLGPAGRREARLDIRRSAILPIVEMARWAATAAGAGPGDTRERLNAAAEAGTLTRSAARTLADAFEVVLDLRVAHQMEQLDAGRPPDDRLDPAAMTPVTRGLLRSVFRAVSAVQQELRQ